MLGALIYEETGVTTGVRVLSVDVGGVKVEVDLTSEGKIKPRGRAKAVAETSLWTYWSLQRPDGSLYGEGKGFMTTADGHVIQLVGSGSAKGTAKDGSIKYRGVVHFHTKSRKWAHLNGAAGVFEYDVGGEGNTALKAWEWK